MRRSTLSFRPQLHSYPDAETGNCAMGAGRRAQQSTRGNSHETGQAVPVRVGRYRRSRDSRQLAAHAAGGVRGRRRSGAETELAEITVTGSRIVRRDFESSSPIVTVGTEMLRAATAAQAVETGAEPAAAVRALADHVQLGDVQPSAFNNPGIVTAEPARPRRQSQPGAGRRAPPAACQRARWWWTSTPFPPRPSRAWRSSAAALRPPMAPTPWAASPISR